MPANPGASRSGADLSSAPSSDPAVLAKAKALSTEGYVMLEEVLPPAGIAEMRAYFTASKCSDPYRKDVAAFSGPENAPKGTHVAFFDNDTTAKAPHAFRIANDPKMLAIAGGMLGAKPTISYMTSWWSVPAGDGSAQHAEKWHRDVDDLRFVKLFLYLTDVDDTAGPHAFVKGSHKVNQLTAIRRYTDEEVDSTFGPEKVVRFKGPAGTAFLENTYGFHRGTPPTKKPRLIFQVLYSLRPTIYGPKHPVARIGQSGIPPGLDSYVNRVYCSAA